MAEKGSGDGLLGWLIGGLLVGLVVLGLLVGAYAVGYDRGKDKGRESASTLPPPTTTTPTSTTSTEPTTTSEADLAAQGKELFASSGCGGCHTLADIGAAGTVGPNLDQAKPSQQLVVDRVTDGLGAMPSFQGQLSSEQIQAIATYVAQAAGG